MCIEQYGFAIYCDTDDETRNKYVKYRKHRADIDLIRCKGQKGERLSIESTGLTAIIAPDSEKIVHEIQRMKALLSLY